jgi:hypothetical protein
MKVKELIKHLKQFDGDMEVAILDGFNGGGHQREINLTPHTRWASGDDVKTETGNQIVVMGYGSY